MGSGIVCPLHSGQEFFMRFERFSPRLLWFGGEVDELIVGVYSGRDGLSRSGLESQRIHPRSYLVERDL